MGFSRYFINLVTKLKSNRVAGKICVNIRLGISLIAEEELASPTGRVGFSIADWLLSRAYRGLRAETRGRKRSISARLR